MGKPLKIGRKQLVTSDEADVTPKQHAHPCSDCPWRRSSLAGWLGADSVQDWLLAAHGENRISCHTLRPPGSARGVKNHWQCAGAAIYRANMCKSVRDPNQLRLPRDTQVVFALPAEFAEHHGAPNPFEMPKRGD